MIKESVKKYLEKYEDKANILKIGYIKEYLQTYILKQIYNYDSSKNLIFYGGTSLRFLFNLNRLSEDLDFIGKDFNDFELLAEHLKNYFLKQNLSVDYKIQKFRIILKFRNFLDDFDFSFGNSKDLYIKIEISDFFDFCKNYKVKLYPVFKNNNSLILKSLDKETLFATKINAVLHRKWEKQDSSGLKITVKGRDIYDLFWYFSNDFKINFDCIIGVNNKEDLRKNLRKIIENINFLEVYEDIKNFLEDEDLLDFFKNGEVKEFLLEKIDDI